MRWGETLLHGASAAAAMLTGLAVAGGIAVTCLLAAPVLLESGPAALLFSGWQPLAGRFGIGPMLAATAVLAATALALAAPVSLGCALLTAGRLAPAPVGRAVRRLVAAMAAIPTVVYGFVGVFLLVPALRVGLAAGSGRCLLAACLMLALMLCPTLVLFFSDALQAVPRSYLDGAAALGARPIQVLFHIQVPAARRGLVAGLVLGLGRAVGDTLISLMLAGNAARLPHGLLSSARSLTAHIALVLAADVHSPQFASIFTSALVLYAFTAAATLLARRLTGKGGRP